MSLLEYLLSPAGAVGPGMGDIATPPVCLSVRPSVRPSVTFSFRTVTKNALLYFLETLQVRAPSDGGVLCSFFILMECCLNFLNI